MAIERDTSVVQASKPASSVARTRPGFNGELHEPFGWQVLGSYRVYDPVLMRFHSPDSLSPFGAGGINPYAYTNNDPVNQTDPSGHSGWSIIRQSLARIVQMGQRTSTPLTGMPLSARLMSASKTTRRWPGRAVRVDSPASINDLPNETLRHIASFVPREDLGVLAATSRRMADVAQDARFRTGAYYDAARRMPGVEMGALVQDQTVPARIRNEIVRASGDSFQEYLPRIARNPGTLMVTENEGFTMQSVLNGEATGILRRELTDRGWDRQTVLTRMFAGSGTQGYLREGWRFDAYSGQWELRGPGRWR